MVVGQLLDWVEGAPDGRRADAARALAQACLLVRTDSPERAAMEAALTVLLDQAQSDVRRALADAFADSETAPRHIVVTLAADQAGIAALVLSRSPLFIDAELIDMLPAASAPLRTAIARRPVVSAVVATAIAEAGDRDNCLALIDNAGAALDRSGYARIAERFGEDPEIREALFGRPDLPPEIHQALVRRTADALGALVIGKAWLSEGRAVAVTREACDRATITIAAETETQSLPGLVEHLRASGQLTTTLILRAVCAGNLDFFEAALATLAQVPIERVANLVAARRLGALHAIYTKAGLPGWRSRRLWRRSTSGARWRRRGATGPLPHAERDRRRHHRALRRGDRQRRHGDRDAAPPVRRRAGARGGLPIRACRRVSLSSGTARSGCARPTSDRGRTGSGSRPCVSCFTVTSTTDLNSTLSATALIGRLSASSAVILTSTWSGRSAPRQVRGRKALIGVSASSGA